MASRTVFDELAHRIRDIARSEAKDVAPPVRRARVLDASPLTVELLDTGVVLEEGDEDFDVSDELDRHPPPVGSIVLVDTDEEGDYVARGIVKRSD